MSLNKKITVPETVLLQKVDDESILLDSENGLYYSLNEVGASIWEFLSEAKTLSDVYTKMLDIYDVDPAQLEKDILNFSKALNEKGLIVLNEAD